MKSKKLKIRNLPKGNCAKDYIKSKPYGFLFFILLISIILGFLHHYLFAFACILFFLYHILFIPNEILVAFYDEYAVFYHVSHDKKECYILFWDEIQQWEIKKQKGSCDYLYVLLKNQKDLQLKCYNVRKTMRSCHKFMEKKEKMIVEHIHLKQ